MVSLTAFRRNKRCRTSARPKPDQLRVLLPIPEDQSCREWQLESSPTVEKTRVVELERRSLRRDRGFESSYSLIDQERSHYPQLRQLFRSSQLERLAQRHAISMAMRREVSHSVNTLPELQEKLGSVSVGENVQRGASVSWMHEQAMTKHAINRQNILGGDFREYGVATVLGKDNLLYMCQYFR